MASFLSNLPERFHREVSSGAYRPEIDGLRFFAIAVVVVGHFFQRAIRFFPHFREVADTSIFGGIFYLAAGLGVSLFFAISGFILASQARKSGLSPLSRKFLKAYYSRRLLRIEPPYFLILIATWALLTATGYQPEGARQFFTEPQSLDLSLLGSLFYVHDLVWGAFPRLFPPGWSLEVEVQFYLIAPLLFWLWFRLENSRLRIVLAASVWFGSCLVSAWAPRQIGPLFIYYSILRYFGFFWLGLVLADSRDALARMAASLSPRWATTIGWIGLIAFLILPEFPDTLLYGVFVRCVAGGAIAAMFVSALSRQSGFRGFCARPWISLIGGACYSLYLVHMQIIQTISVVVARHAADLSFAGVIGLMAGEIAIVGIAGLAFYVCVERPFMAPHWPTRALSRIRRGLSGKTFQGQTSAARSLGTLPPGRLAIARLCSSSEAASGRFPARMSASRRVAAARP
jgi:peptidoglycan/LPS O-acetylase OafA/YrhL